MVDQLVFSSQMKQTFEYVLPLAEGENKSVIVGVGSVESSYLVQAVPCVNSYLHEDLAAIRVFIQYLTQLEGPMWRQIRGLGLSYHYRYVSDYHWMDRSRCGVVDKPLAYLTSGCRFNPQLLESVSLYFKYLSCPNMTSAVDGRLNTKIQIIRWIYHMFRML